MVYKYGLSYFSYFCSPTTYERAFRIHKKSVTTRSKGILSP